MGHTTFRNYIDMAKVILLFKVHISIPMFLFTHIDYNLKKIAFFVCQ